MEKETYEKTIYVVRHLDKKEYKIYFLELHIHKNPKHCIAIHRADSRGHPVPACRIWFKCPSTAEEHFDRIVMTLKLEGKEIRAKKRHYKI